MLFGFDPQLLSSRRGEPVPFKKFRDTHVVEKVPFRKFRGREGV